MKLELIPLSEGDKSRAWGLFSKSPIQAVLHNEVVGKILELREKVETVSTVDLPELQSRIKAHREFLGLIHRHDALATK